MKEYIVIGKTVEEAAAAAHAQYDRDGDVSYEIVEMPKKGFLGLGATPAKLKVFVSESMDIGSILSGITEKRPQQNSPKRPENRPEHRPETGNEIKTTARYQDNRPKPNQPQNNGQNQPGSQPAGQNPNQNRGGMNNNGQNRRNKGPKPQNGGQNQPRVQNQNQPKPQNAPKANPPKARDLPVPEITEEEMGYAITFAQQLLRDMEIDAKVVRTVDAEGKPEPRLNIEGDDTGILIGHHGETLDAIQYLLNLSANRKSGSDVREFVRISVDVENYREKREEALRALARRMAEKCKKYKKNIVLEPMNPYERRIIHSEIQDIEDVSTHSVGYDENRKIVVTYEGADKPQKPQKSGKPGARNGKPGEGGRNRRRHGSGEGRVPAAEKPVAPVEREPEYPDDLMDDNYAAEGYTWEKKPSCDKPVKMSFEDFAAALPEDIPMGILSRKKDDGEV